MMITEQINNIINKSAAKNYAAQNDKNFKTFTERGIAPAGQLFFPFDSAIEKREITVNSISQSTVGVDFKPFEQAFYNTSTLYKAGARFLNNLQNNCTVPVINHLTAYTANETATATANDATVTNVKLEAGRLSTVVEVSKQYITQNSEDVEKVVATALMNAVNEKIETEVLKMIASKKDAAVNVATYSDIVDAEALMNAAEHTYITSRTAKKALKKMQKTSASNVYDNNMIDCLPTFTTNVVDKAGTDLFILGDWSQVVCGVWGIDITVDHVSKAKDNIIKLIVNAYVDYNVLDPEAFTVFTTYQETTTTE